MKFPGLLLPLWLVPAALMLSESVADLQPADPPPADDLISGLIVKLADDDYQTRLDATRDLWNIGEPALEALRQAADSREPEAVHRAVDLIRKIELHITPDTDARVIELVELYVNAPLRDRPDIMRQLHHRRAWRQILKLYAGETDADLRSKMKDTVNGVAGLAARERLTAGDQAGAREFLELAPADDASLLALADFHRANGTWEEEFEKARVSAAKGAAAWRLALHRAVGNHPEAIAAAEEAGKPQAAAMLAILHGDPLPWIRHEIERQGATSNSSHYAKLAAARWAGQALTPEDYEPLTRMLEARSPELRATAANGLFLLGNISEAEKALVNLSPGNAFGYFDSLERVDEAIAAFGLDPAEPDFTAWFAARFKSILADPETVGDHGELADFAAFMAARGLHDELAAAIESPLGRLARKSEEGFLHLLSMLAFSNPFDREPPFLWEFRRSTGLPAPAIRVAAAWAGDDEIRWQEIIIAIFGENPEIDDLWAWLGELDPNSSLSERLHGLFALCNLGKDPEKRRDRWLELAWREVDEAPDQERRSAQLFRILNLTKYHEDAATHLRAWDLLEEADREEFRDPRLYDRFSVAGRWGEVADFLLEAVGEASEAGAPLTAATHASLASTLRNAGRVEEAESHDALADRLVLGDSTSALRIAGAYAGGGDYERAAVWHARAARWCPPESLAMVGSRMPDNAHQAFSSHAEDLLHGGQWVAAAAISEVMALRWSRFPAEDIHGISFLRSRLAADLPHALALLKTDRDRALAMLERCHAMLPRDGSLADDFFPSLRKAGLTEEHDAWFEATWAMMSETIKRFPGADNSLNTAGWLASRSVRRLAEAEAMLERALALNPNQPAYLDTYGEIEFARGNREQAVKWSGLALNFMPSDPMIRKQHVRFMKDPFPEAPLD